MVERLIISLKDECLRRILVPLGIGAMRIEVARYVDWYNQHRPHQSLGGRTPDEVYYDRAAANEMPRLEPRARYPAASRCAAPQVPIGGKPGCALRLVVSHPDGAPHLPVVRLEKIELGKAA